MSSASAAQLAELLQKHILRIQTGIVLLGQEQLGREEELIARLRGVGGVDLWNWKVKQLAEGTRYLGLSEESIIQDLHTIAIDRSIPGNCIWVYNSDVLISRLGSEDRARLWQSLLKHFRPPRGLMVSLPKVATNLLPVDERKTWEREERLAT